MRPPVAMHHRLENLRLQGEHSLHPLRRDIVALVVDDNVLLAVGDDQPPAIVEVADIAGMEPALLQNPRRFRVVAPIAVHHQLAPDRSEEHTSELQSLMRISYAVFCLKKKKKPKNN